MKEKLIECALPIVPPGTVLDGASFAMGAMQVRERKSFIIVLIF